MNRMLRRMPAPLFMEWSQFDALEPFGEERADLRASVILQMLVNLNRNQKKHPRPFPLDDFILRIGDAAPEAPVRTQSTAQQFNILKAIAAAYAKQPGGGPPPRARRAKQQQ